MNKGLILIVSILWLAPMAQVIAQQEVTVDWLGFAQLTAERIENSQSDFRFGTERARPRVQVNGGPFSGVVQLDFAASDLSAERPGTLANVMLDLYADYRFSDRHRVRLGQFKTPLGMDFNVPARSLDITKRGMELGLTLNRDLGLMLSGAIVGDWLSYDLGVFNPPGRSQATEFLDSQVGQDTASVARLRFDEGAWHAEAAYGRAANAGGPVTSAYTTTDIGLRYELQRWRVKGEWIEGRNIRGEGGRSERVYYLHGGYQLRPNLELVARHYAGRSENGAGTTELSNTYIGFSATLADYGRMRTRLQANYVIAGGDEISYTGVRGFRDNALFFQLQVYVAK